jgi:hypothetical protein
MVSPSTVLNSRSQVRILPRRFLNLSPVFLVASVAAILSLIAFFYFFANGMTNVYGDGIAHVNISRKVVDSLDHGFWRHYIQIGSPWLPLQTVLMLPFVANDWMWRTGAAGSIVSMLSFVIAAVSIFLLARRTYKQEDDRVRAVLPIMSAGIFVLNPSVLYMQATPMSELLFMATLVLAVWLLQRWRDDQTRKALLVAGSAMSLATLSRYEAWPVALLSVLLVLLNAAGDWKEKIKGACLFAFTVALGPLYWFWHNWAIYDNAFEFLSGPNSARGIALQNRVNFAWSSIFVGHALLDFAVIVAAAAVCAGPFVLLMGVTGLTRLLIANRRVLLERSPLLLLILPFIFQVFSVYRGEIQIFPLSAFGLLNIRYGLPHVLCVALFAPATVLIFKGKVRRWTLVGTIVAIALQYGSLVSEGPSQLAVYQEGFRNGVNSRPARQYSRVSAFLTTNPPRPLILMHTGALGPVVSKGGLEFSNIIHEGTERWHQLNEGIPGDVGSVIFQDGDALDSLIRENPKMTRSLSEDFEQRMVAGNVRVYAHR